MTNIDDTLSASEVAGDEIVCATIDAILQDVRPISSTTLWHFASDEITHVFSTSGSSRGSHLETELRNFAVATVSASDRGSDTILTAQPHQHGTLLIATIPVLDSIFTVTALLGVKEPAASARRQRSFARFLPVIEVAFRDWLSRRKLLSDVRGLRAAVDCSGIPTFLLSRRGEVLIGNSAGEALLSRDDGIYRRRGLLSGPTLAETLRLQTTLEHLFGRASADDKSARVVVFERAARRPLLLFLTLADAALDNPYGGTAVVYISDPEQDSGRYMEPACKYFGLSASETRLACLLTRGGTLAEAAGALGVREQTVRSYLKQIFLKTGTNRQAELVSLLLKSTVPVTVVPNESAHK